MNSKALLISTLFFVNSLNGQTLYPYHSAVAGFEYIEVIKGKDNGKLPLLIAFHYSSGNPAETIADYDSLKNPVRIIIPKGNYKKRNGFSYYPVDYYEKDSLTQFVLSKKAVDSIGNFIQLIGKKYKSKAVVSGISQGGDIAMLLAAYYPQLCKASFPFAAYIHSGMNHELKKKPVGRVPVYLFQGEDDPIIPLSTTRRKLAMLDKKLRLKLFSYPALGHDISTQMKIDYSRLIDELNVAE